MRLSLLLVACLALAATPALVQTAEAQAPANTRRGAVVPRTPDGRPDFQGNWTNSTLTPFQRQAGRGPAYTWEEVARIERGDEECPPNP
jgi:hypothetical protein